MDVQAFVTQAVLAAIRHALTAGGLLGTVVSDQQLVQIGGVVTLAVGLLWSLARKWKTAKKPA